MSSPPPSPAEDAASHEDLTLRLNQLALSLGASEDESDSTSTSPDVTDRSTGTIEDNVSLFALQTVDTHIDALEAQQARLASLSPETLDDVKCSEFNARLEVNARLASLIWHLKEGTTPDDDEAQFIEDAVRSVDHDEELSRQIATALIKTRMDPGDLNERNTATSIGASSACDWLKFALMKGDHLRAMELPLSDKERRSHQTAVKAINQWIAFQASPILHKEG